MNIINKGKLPVNFNNMEKLFKVFSFEKQKMYFSTKKLIDAMKNLYAYDILLFLDKVDIANSRVFEGDILETVSTKSRLSKILVSFNEDRTQVLYQVLTSNKPWRVYPNLNDLNADFLLSYRFKVIGNIYETPEFKDMDVIISKYHESSSPSSRI